MAYTNLDSVMRYIRRAAGSPDGQGATDSQLLTRYLYQRDGESFALLVSRHGPLVHSVCRRVLQHEHDAEDAFQATFLVLASKANSIRKAVSLASWLHGVAYRISLRAKKATRRQVLNLNDAGTQTLDMPATTAALREAQAIVDDELTRLPRKYRDPFVLCCLESKSRAEAARELGWKEGTVASRIAQARKTLQQRLTRRGVVLSTILCLWDLSHTKAPALGPAIVNRTAEAAISFVVGQGSASHIACAPAVDLVRGMLLAMSSTSKLKFATIVVLACGFLTATGAVVHRARSLNEEGVSSEELHNQLTVAVTRDEQPPARPAQTGEQDDPLPPRALARLGTLRQRAPDSQIALTADGKEIVAVSSSLIVRRFDALTGQLRSTTQLPATQGLQGPWLSSHGTYLLVFPSSMSVKTTLDLWEIASGRVLKRLPMEGGMPCSASFSSDEQRVAIASSGGFRTGEVIEWDLQTDDHKVLWSQEKATDRIYFYPVVVMSPDGKKIAASHVDMDLRYWDADSGKKLWEVEGAGSEYFFFSRDSKKVLGAPRHMDSTRTCVWDATTGKLNQEFDAKISFAFPVGVSPDDRLLTYQTAKGEIALWDKVTEKPTFSFADPAASLTQGLYLDTRAQRKFAFTSDGSALIRLSSTLQRLDLKNGKTVFEETASRGHTEEVNNVVYSPDGTLIATCSTDRTVRLWDSNTGNPTHCFVECSGDFLAFTPDSKCLYAQIFGRESLLRRWDTSTGRVEQDFEMSPKGTIKDMRITDKGTKVLVLMEPNNVPDQKCILMIYETVSGKLLVSKSVPWSSDAVLTPDGESVIALDKEARRLRKWDIHTESPRLQFESDHIQDPRRRAFGCDLALSRRGSWIASHPHLLPIRPGGAYDDIRVSDVSTGKQVAKIPFPNQAIFTFSADETKFAVAATDSIRLWSTATWKELGAIKVPNRPESGGSKILALAFSPDGSKFATGHADSTILIWSTQLE